MGINMIQDFSLETDDLGDLQSVLNVVFPIHIRPYRMKRLYLSTKLDGYFDDGHENESEVFGYTEKTTGQHHSLKRSRWYGGICWLDSEKSSEDQNIIVSHVSEQRKRVRIKPQYQFVARIGGLHDSEDPKENMQVFYRLDELFQGLQEILKAVDKDDFDENHEHPLSRSFDGTIKVGYRATNCHSFRDEINISLCHILYGK